MVYSKYIFSSIFFYCHWLLKSYLRQHHQIFLCMILQCCFWMQLNFLDESIIFNPIHNLWNRVSSNDFTKVSSGCFYDKHFYSKESFLDKRAKDLLLSMKVIEKMTVIPSFMVPVISIQLALHKFCSTFCWYHKIPWYLNVPYLVQQMLFWFFTDITFLK